MYPRSALKGTVPRPSSLFFAKLLESIFYVMSSSDEEGYHSAKLRAMMTEVAVSPYIGTGGDSSGAVRELAFRGFLSLSGYDGALLI